MSPITKEKLRINARNCWRFASTWVMAAAGLGFAAYLALPVDEQRDLLSRLPLIPPWLVPILTSAIGVGARIWPQKNIPAEVAAAKSDLLPLGPPEPRVVAPAPGEERQEGW